MRRSLPLILAVLGVFSSFAVAQDTIADVQAKAEAGDKVAQFLLGRAYYSGSDGLPRDEITAMPWFRKAADQGQVNAQTYLGYMYEEGRGVKKDEAQAVEWYRKAAEQGERNAQRNLGMMYADGRGGLTKSDTEAVNWYRKAAEQGDPSAQNSLGQMYQRGGGSLKQDVGEALAWYRKSADQGYANAQNNAAILMLMNRSPEIRNPRGALDYASKAVAQYKYNLIFLETLAEAYYVNEQFEQAVETMRQIMTIAPAEKMTGYTASLDRYQRALTTINKRELKSAGSFRLK
jgi:TPR repeat protein